MFKQGSGTPVQNPGRGSLKGRLEQNPSEGVVKSKRVHNLWVGGGGGSFKGRLGQNPAEKGQTAYFSKSDVEIRRPSVGRVLEHPGFGGGLPSRPPTPIRLVGLK